MTFNLSNKDNYLWNAMITVLSANFTQVSATETECWCKLNCETRPKTKACVKQNGIRWCQQCNKQMQYAEIECDLLKDYELKQIM